MKYPFRYSESDTTHDAENQAQAKETTGTGECNADKEFVAMEVRTGKIETTDGQNEIGERNAPESKSHISDAGDRIVDDAGNNVGDGQTLQPNSTFVLNGIEYNTDDNGHIYKIDGYELMPDCEYTIDGISYKTDSSGRIILCDGNARFTPDGERDERAQKTAGGEDRRPGDQGGHILARIFGGAKGVENMLAMRGTAINQSVYKRMENEIGKALEEGKKVHVHVNVEYEGDSKRPSKITAAYTIDGKETKVMFDNDEGSTALLDALDGKIGESDLQDLKDEIQNANEDGANMSVVSIKTEYDEDGNATKVTVTVRDENGEPHPVNENRVYEPKGAML